MKRFLPLIVFLLPALGLAQPEGPAQIQPRLQRLTKVGSVLMIAAHPDDENTNLLAYFANGRHLRTGYLSLTRGEGGQNLIGSEQGDSMGLIRTQELLAARRVDGAEQYFSRAIDFGFSKTAAETLSKWGREAVLGDVVWTIRNFRPDVIVLRFSGTPRDGHGQHQSSAILGKEAFAAAADPARFPEQLQYVKPWRARRLFFNLFAFTAEMEKENAKVANRLEVDPGEYNPILGLSYGEIAGRSRSRHASQGMGSAERRGAIKDSLVVIAGEPAVNDPLEGVDTSWNRLPGGMAVGDLLAEALREFRAEQPEKILPLLLKARPLVAAMDHPDAIRKLRELDETITLCAGIWADASSAAYAATPGSSARLTLSVVGRLRTPVTFVGATLEGSAGAPKVAMGETSLPYNQAVQQRVEWQVPADAAYSQPYWLARPKRGALYDVADLRRIGQAENAPVLSAHFRFRVEGVEFTAVRPLQHRYVDSVRGELTRPFLVVPAVAVELPHDVFVFPAAGARTVQVAVKANVARAAGRVRLEAGAGWKVTPAEMPFMLEKVGEQTTVSFTVTPPAEDSTAELRAVAEVGGRPIGNAMRVISYPHIPPVTVFPPAVAKLVRADIRVLSKNAGYVMGAGDEAPEALRQLGIQVALLSDEDLAGGDLSKYDAIVTGVRAFNTRAGLRANFQRLLDYVKDGGTLVEQYNVLEGFQGRENRDSTSQLGPYPLKLSRERVTVEEAPVMFANANHPLLQSPNRITEKDFEGWVQERGLYFATEYDARYQSLFASKDPGGDWLPGGTLYAPYGKGAFVYTSYAWFRQLPAGVPGAYRIFANLLSAGKN